MQDGALMDQGPGNGSHQVDIDRTLHAAADVGIELAAEIQDLSGLRCNSERDEIVSRDRSMLADLDRQQVESAIASIEGGAANIQDIYPLSPLQEGMLFHHLLNEWRDSYVLSTFFELQSEAQVPLLIDAAQKVINRHDVLRTAVLWENQPRPLQVVHRKASVRVKQVVLASGGDPLKQLQEHLASSAPRMSVQKAPLVALLLASDADSPRWYAVLQVHHLICDHQSLVAVVDELIACLAGSERQLPEPVPFKRYVARAFAEVKTGAAEAFFRRKLADVHEATTPFGLFDVHGDGSQIDEYKEVLDPQLARRVRIQARHVGTTPARLFHAAWSLVVAHTTGREDVVFGTVLLASELRGRDASPQSMLGPVINTLPLRLQLSAVTARELVDRTNQELAELLTHETAPLTLAQRCSGLTGAAPLFSSLLNCRRGGSQPHSDCDNAAGVRVMTRVGARTNYPLTVSMNDLGEGFELTVHTDRRIASYRVASYFQTAIRSLTRALEQAPQTSAMDLPILPETEQRRLLELFNTTEASYPRDKLVHELFQQQARERAETLAVVYEEQSLTYSLLNRRANQLARYLRRRGAKTGEFVAVVMSRSPLMVIAQLAVLKSGCVYVPIDPELPTDRVAFMIRDCRSHTVLAADAPPDSLELRGVNWIDCLLTARTICREPDDDLEPLSRPAPPAYVMYTSGSTGMPKGVIVPHHAINRLVINNGYAQIEPEDCLAHYSNPAFDASTLEIWGALLNGARVAIVSQSTVLDPQRFTSALREHAVTVLYMSVGLFNQYAEAMSGCFAQLRYLMVGGDTLEPSTIRSVLETGPPQHLLNVYGPTECTTFSTTYVIRSAAQCAASIPIGYPMSNARVYILDGARRVVPIGVAGELYIGGAGVASGYLDRPELTAERFLPDPFSSEPSARMYKTGDLCRWRPDGVIEYLGRNDFQVKIRGFRIELGEIEAQLARYPEVKEVVVLARQDEPGEKRLVAYLTVSDPLQAPSAESLRQYLQATMPEYMVPSAMVVLAQMPLTVTGKVDRRALPPPALSAYSVRAYRAPQGHIEQTLARIWRDLLGVERVGRDDNFFELGGHSLLVLQALFRIKQSLHASVRVKDVYDSPTLRELALRVGGEAVQHELVDLAREATLALDIVTTTGVRPVAPANVLLTGSTGFVGRFLLAQLLQETRSTIHCLMRARSPRDGAAALKEKLVASRLWRDEFEQRLVAICGDLRKPHLGLAEPTYNGLCRRIDTIYHCATSMNHLETYEMAKAANVAGAQELIRLATRLRPKLIHCMSTVSVFSTATTGQVRAVNEYSTIDQEKHSTATGYAASKWVAEKIFMLASERGIPCNIFRLGLVWADTQQGRYDKLQRGYRLLKSCLMAGRGIKDYRYSMPPTPVDYVAQALVFLAGRHLEGGGLFHISSSSQMTDGIFERCNAVAGTSLELVSFYDWIQEMRRLHEAGRSLPVVPLVEFAFRMDEEAFNEHQRLLQTQRIELDCAQTHRELEQAGIVAPVLNDTLLRLCVTNMLAN